MNSPAPFRYVGPCTNFPGEGHAINEMTRAAQRVTADEMAQHCDLAALSRKLGYSTRPLKHGIYAGQSLTLTTDPHVTFHRSTFKGQPCYYLRHSAFEHIFTGRN